MFNSYSIIYEAVNLMYWNKKLDIERISRIFLGSILLLTDTFVHFFTLNLT